MITKRMKVVLNIGATTIYTSALMYVPYVSAPFAFIADWTGKHVLMATESWPLALLAISLEVMILWVAILSLSWLMLEKMLTAIKNCPEVPNE